MSRHRIVRRSEIARTARVKQLEGMFDLPPSKRAELTWDVSLPIEDKPWQIGLIHGPSGCGKSTIAREVFGDKLIAGFPWTTGRTVIDDFPENLPVKEVTGLLSAVGFSSPPAWLRPFSALSNGEQFRVTLARALAESPDLAVIDEFTSVVDRTVAKIGSAAVSKAIRSRPNVKFVAVACHDDIVNWLQPDWTFEPHTGAFHWRSLQQRPAIELQVRRVSSRHWREFAHHHYLTASLMTGAECYLATVEGRPAAFAGIITNASEGCWRESRIVCLPDFQGIGIGNKFSEFLGSVYRGCGCRYMSKTGHPAMIRHRYKSTVWRVITRLSAMTPRPGPKQRATRKTARGRSTAGFEYTGPALAPALAKAIRRVDLTEYVRERPNRTADRYAELAGVSTNIFRRWADEEIARGRVIRSGSGRGIDRTTYRLADG